jgi:Fe-Mn family superoxide dismutase
MERRVFLKWSIGTGTLAALALMGWGCSRDDKDSGASIRLSALPYEQGALAPYLSADTLRLHYGKHHRGYAEQANHLVQETALAKLSLLELVRKSYKTGACEQPAIFNNAAQVYNHTFYWNSMRPQGGGPPSGLMAEWLDKSFGGYQAFRKAFTEAALGRFASGWVWLVLAEGQLTVVATGNADTPVVHGLQPLLVLDVWEHAYYLDYQNRRDRYVEAFLDHLVNWDFAAHNLGDA